MLEVKVNEYGIRLGYLLLGAGFLLVAYLLYRGIKGERSSSSKTDWKGPTGTAYVQYWGGIILCSMGGIVFIVKSLF
jgi:hypothetical protein